MNKREIESDVVSDDDRVANELKERWQYGFDPRRRQHHGMGDASEDRYLRRDRTTRIHESLEGADAFAAAKFDGSDFGDAAEFRRAAGGLEVDDTKGHFRKRCAEVVERQLRGDTGGGAHPYSLIERVFACKEMFSASLVSLRVFHPIPLHGMRKSHPI